MRLLFVTIALALVLAGCADAPDAVVPADWDVFETPGFSIAYPPDWSPRAPEDQTTPAFDVELERTGNQAPTPGVGVGVETGQTFAALGIDEFTAAFVAQQAIFLPDHDVVERQPVDIPGALEALQLTVDYSEPFEDGPDPHREYLVLAIVGDFETVIVRTAAPAEEWEALQPTFDAMLASLQFDLEGILGQDA